MIPGERTRSFGIARSMLIGALTLATGRMPRARRSCRRPVTGALTTGARRGRRLRSCRPAAPAAPTSLRGGPEVWLLRRSAWCAGAPSPRSAGPSPSSSLTSRVDRPRRDARSGVAPEILTLYFDEMRAGLRGARRDDREDHRRRDRRRVRPCDIPRGRCASGCPSRCRDAVWHRDAQRAASSAVGDPSSQPHGDRDGEVVVVPRPSESTS